MSDAKMKHWDGMYSRPPENIPWEIQQPPKELVELLSCDDAPKKGRALDIACGTGNYSFYLAQNGFDVVGVDFSENALAAARKKNEDSPHAIDFKHVDITKMDGIFESESFDFIFDYTTLHHLEDADIPGFVDECWRMLKPGGKVLLVCYSDEDDDEDNQKLDTGDVAQGKYGNIIFFRTKDEIRNFYNKFSEIYYKDARLGKRNHHIAHCFLFEK